MEPAKVKFFGKRAGSKGYTFISKACKGYTFIEILVGLSVVGLIFSFGFVSFREFSRRQSLIVAASNLKGELRFAQERALSGQKPDEVSCNDPNSLEGYNFRVVDPGSFAIEAVCSGGNVEVKTITLSGDLAISAPSPNPILFKVLGHGTNIGAGLSGTITLTQVDSGATQDVVVSSSGEIN